MYDGTVHCSAKNAVTICRLCCFCLGSNAVSYTGKLLNHGQMIINRLGKQAQQNFPGWYPYDTAEARSVALPHIACSRLFSNHLLCEIQSSEYESCAVLLRRHVPLWSIRISSRPYSHAAAQDELCEDMDSGYYKSFRACISKVLQMSDDGQRALLQGACLTQQTPFLKVILPCVV
jgi:hypothetical protein